MGLRRSKISGRGLVDQRSRSDNGRRERKGGSLVFILGILLFVVLFLFALWAGPFYGVPEQSLGTSSN